MIALKELKQYADLHVKTHSFQAINPRQVLQSIERAASEEPTAGAWDWQWVDAANKCLQANAIEDAIQCYNFARFPFPQTSLQQEAAARLTKVFEQAYCREDVQKHRVYYDNQKVTVYAANLHPDLPCLLVLGGIVSIKEQWSVFLQVGKRLGFSVLITECPGVGENQVRYHADSYRMIGQILDTFAEQAKVGDTYIVGMSFGGHLAMKQALHDERIKGITTVGAPLHYFFQDYSQLNVPFITQATLAHVMEEELDHVGRALSRFAFMPKELNKLKIPITYIFSTKDEIIPKSEKSFLLDNIANLTFYEFDDVHGSPNHLPLIQKIIPLSILKHSNSKRYFVRIMLAFLLTYNKWKGRDGKR
ncbi:alpha/beta fold hydrolase [Halalkalibacterium halodurans]|uniref:AB hydrolase-1 domain-containing protein n=1 Tax=Halalkalibacterium halodurans TaxID=86665 RepID=A0A0M0KK53_ALKHA|nr:alpha/beta fold hydrolase [Halalkalibacterium halodurans]TPE70955.1 alpha/beta fold hydrolase [Halalkalibacterium halodurans]